MTDGEKLNQALEWLNDCRRERNEWKKYCQELTEQIIDLKLMYNQEKEKQL